MTLLEAFNTLKTSIENTAIAAVKSLKAHTFKADIGEKAFRVTNFPKVQEIQGKVVIENQQDLEKHLKVVNDWLKQVKEALGTLKPKDEVKVSNFPKIEFPAFPKQMKVSEPIDVSEKSFKAVLGALGELTALIKKLPTEYPEVKIPPFPKIPDFPAIPKPAPFPKSFSVDNLETLKSDDPKQYVPVRLSDGQKFYQALEELSIAAGRSYAYSDSEGVKQQALVDGDRHVQVDVLTMPNQTPEGLATEAKQEEIKEAIENIVFPEIQKTQEQEASPTDSSKLNPSYSYTYTEGNLTQIQMTVGDTIYQKEFTWTDGVMTSESVWSEV
jgi:hypothetical protein